jgi:hypothetical protein
LKYSIPDQTATVHDLLLQKADGTFELVVWAERFMGGSETVSVEVIRAVGSVRLFDPTIGVSAVRPLPNASSISFTLSNHPTVLELSGSAR